MQEVTSRPVWLDEVTAATLATTKSFKDLFTMNHWDSSHPPLYWVWLKVWSLIQFNTIWLRLPSVILSLVGSVFLFLFSKKMLRSNLSALVITGIWTLGDFMVGLSAQIRPYGMIQCLSFVYLYLFHIQMREEKPRLWLSIGLILCTTLGIWGDYSFWWVFFLSLAVWLTCFFFPKQFPGYIFSRRHFSILIGIWLPVLCWLPFLMYQLPYTLELNSYIQVSGDFIQDYGGWVREMTGIREGYINVMFLLVLMTAGMSVGNRNKSMKLWKMYMIGFLLIPIFSLLFSYLFSPIFQPRNVFIGYVGVVGLIGLLMAGNHRLLAIICVGVCGYFIQTKSMVGYPQYWYFHPLVDVVRTTEIICSRYPNDAVLNQYIDEKGDHLYAFFQYYLTATNLGCKNNYQVLSTIDGTVDSYILIMNRGVLLKHPDGEICEKLEYNLRTTQLYKCLRYQ